MYHIHSGLVKYHSILQTRYTIYTALIIGPRYTIQTAFLPTSPGLGCPESQGCRPLTTLDLVDISSAPESTLNPSVVCLESGPNQPNRDHVSETAQINSIETTCRGLGRRRLVFPPIFQCPSRPPTSQPPSRECPGTPLSTWARARLPTLRGCTCMGALSLLGEDRPSHSPTLRASLGGARGASFRERRGKRGGGTSLSAPHFSPYFQGSLF